MKNIGLVFILLFPFYCFPQFTIHKGFSEFSESPANGKEMKRIVADFDKDNKGDVMTVIYQSKYKEDSAIKKYLIIYISSKKKTFFIDFDLFNGVYVVPLKYKNDVLDFLIYQDGTGVYGHGLKLRFNQKVKEIQLIGYDYSYRTTNGHCSKTYNLLTGDYIVTNDYYNWEKDKTEFENFRGNKKQFKSIFIKDFTFKLFERLSLIGKEYEK